MTSENQQAGSFDPGDHTAGGFLDDVDATIVSAEVVTFDFRGTIDPPVCAAAISFRPDDADEDAEPRTEYYKIGDLAKFTPSPDKKRYVPVGTATAMNNKSKCSLFMQALKAAGFKMSELNGPEGIKALEGLHVHVNIAPLPDFTDKDGKTKKDNKILVVTKILDTPAPGQKAAKGGAKKTAAAPKTNAAAPQAAAPAADADVEAAAVETILAVLGEKGGKANKTTLPGECFKRITDTATRNAVIKLVGNPAWLGDGERPWQLTGGELSLG